MGRAHAFFCAHWDREPRRVRSAGFRACGSGRLSSRPFLVHRTRKSGKPAGWKACGTSRFMESLHAFFVAHWDQEPEIRKLFGIKPSVFRFMESLHAFFVAHWDQEPEIRKLFGIKPSVFRFMESLLSLLRTHWDHEPVALPLTRPSDTLSLSGREGWREGGAVHGEREP